jgi:DNA replication protein DnaC
MDVKCAICQDSGWVLVRVGEREIARPCSCRQSDAQFLKSSSANIPPRFFGLELKSFFPDKASPSQAKAKKAAERFVGDYPAVGDVGLFFQGAVGVGKTLLLCGIGNELIKGKDVDAVYIDWNDLTREMRSGEDFSNRDFSNIGQLVQRLASAELLLFDEIGSSRPSPWVEDNIYYLINRRYNENKVTLFASNYRDDKIGDEETLVERIGERIRSRLYEMAKTIRIEGGDKRRKIFKEQ